MTKTKQITVFSLSALLMSLALYLYFTDITLAILLTCLGFYGFTFALSGVDPDTPLEGIKEEPILVDNSRKLPVKVYLPLLLGLLIVFGVLFFKSTQ